MPYCVFINGSDQFDNLVLLHVSGYMASSGWLNLAHSIVYYMQSPFLYTKYFAPSNVANESITGGISSLSFSPETLSRHLQSKTEKGFCSKSRPSPPSGSSCSRSDYWTKPMGEELSPFTHLFYRRYQSILWRKFCSASWRMTLPGTRNPRSLPKSSRWCWKHWERSPITLKTLRMLGN